MARPTAAISVVHVNLTDAFAHVDRNCRRSGGARVINTSFVMGELNVPLMEAVGNATQAGVFVSA